MEKKTRKQIEALLTRLCVATGLPRAIQSGAVGVFLEKGPSGYSIRQKVDAKGGEIAPFGALGICESLPALWTRMDFALTVIAAGTLKRDADQARDARAVLEAEEEWSAGTLEDVARELGVEEPDPA